jgi:putative copper export protein/mono/diheme cytochrome c family protein
MDAMIVAARTVHFASAMLLFGELLLAVAIATPVLQKSGRAALDRSEGLLSVALAWGTWALAASVISGVTWFAAEASIMSGMPIAQAIGDNTIGLVLGGTTFGRLWVWRLVLAVALGALLLAIGRSAGQRQRVRLAIGAVLVAAAYLATLAWAGHAAAGPESGPQVQTVSDVVHLLAAGAWIGALPGFVVLLGRAQSVDVAARVAQRFSTLGVLSVGALVVSGLGNAWYLVGDVPALIGTQYGRLLLVKLALFAAMVALAAVNRWGLTVRLNPEDPLNVRALRSLRRNAIMEIAAGMIVVAIVGVLGTMVPAAHATPVWPFAHALSWQAVQPSFGMGTIVVTAGIVACIAAGAAITGLLRGRWRIGMVGLGAMMAAAATCARLLAVPAYPTTYASPPVSYTTDSIVRGANTYAQSCVVCHGPYGRGDGSAAMSLPVLPADLAAHSSSHLPGELFWWVTHGIPGTPMPGFTPPLGNDEIWDLVQFLRAQSDAADATTLGNRVQPWRTAIVAPDFTFELGGQEQESLRQPQRNSITLLVLYSLPQSLGYLRALAAATSTFAEVGARIVAVPLSGAPHSTDAQSVGSANSIVAIAPGDAIRAYLMFDRQDGAAPAAAPAELDYLIDLQGYVRARWIGVPDSPLDRVAETFDQAELLRRERQRAPIPPGHRH